MAVLNSSPFTFAWMPGRMNYPGHSLTLIVKGTFTLSPGQKAGPAPEQLYPTGDEYYADDQEMTGAPRYESDFAYFKPHADLMLVGKCYSPRDKPAPSCTATFQVGDRAHSIAVFGDRSWKRNALGFRNPTDPAPFRAMDLRYEKSYGGEGYGGNPIGRGFAKTSDETGAAVFPLPNLEDPIQLIDSPRTHPEPAGFGPLSRNWEQRHERMGTYKGAYMKQHWPWFPQDFDWTYFNGASPEMQVQGYLRGNERLYFENLHPKHSQYETWLPGLRVRCFVSKSADPADASGFLEAPLNLDTLWIDMEAEKLVLVWRGWVETSSEEHEDIQHVFIKSEEIQAPKDSIDDCHRQFLAFIAEEKRKWEGQGEEAPAPVADEPAAATKTDVEADPPKEHDEQDALKQLLTAQTAALLAQAGIDPNELPIEARTRLAEEQSRVLQIFSNRDPAKLREADQRRFQSQVSDAFNNLGMDAKNLPPLSEKAKAEQFRFFKELDFGDAAPPDSHELSQLSLMLGALMPKMGIDPENLDSLIAEAKKLKQRIAKELGVSAAETGKAVAENSNPPVKPTREIVQERAQRGESFAGEDLRGLDLSDLQLNGVDFSEAILAGVCLQRASLDDSNLTGANVEGADLAGAALNRATLAQANLSKCNLTGAALNEVDATEAVLAGSNLRRAAISSAVFERAKMAQAILDGATGRDTIFTEADLYGASMKKVSLPAADFSRSRLGNTNFQGADLTDANFDSASGPAVIFRDANLSGLRASEGADFSQGCFVKATAPESCWEEARMPAADFSYARMEAANFTNALLEGANFYASDVKFGRFRKANLTNAKLVQMNLFEGTLEKADLTGTDLRGSNLYGAEFLDARLELANLKDANLKMTKLG